jgi:hypothetical protein
VYVDDIIVSCDTKNDVAASLAQIRLAAQLSRFPINERKSQGPSAMLRAFNIDIDAGVMEIASERYEEMCRKVLMNGASPVSRGILSYVQSVSPAQAGRMLREFPGSFPND